MDFACKSFSLDELIRCSLGLTKAEYKILDFLMKNQTKKFNTEMLSKNLRLDLSTIQRSMKKMNEKKLVKRSQINLSVGYSFVYCICNKKDIKQIISSNIKNWTDNFYLEIEKW